MRGPLAFTWITDRSLIVRLDRPIDCMPAALKHVEVLMWSFQMVNLSTVAIIVTRFRASHATCIYSFISTLSAPSKIWLLVGLAPGLTIRG